MEVPASNLRELTKSTLPHACLQLLVTGAMHIQQLCYLMAMELPNLKELDLRGIDGVPPEILACLRAKKLPKLRSIHLYLSAQKEHDMRDLLGAGWDILEEFHLEVDAAGTVPVLHPDALLQQLETCPNLKQITFWGIKFTEPGFRSFASAHSKNLEVFGFDLASKDINLMEPILSAMASFEWPKLESVGFEEIKASDLELIASSNWVKKLKFLKLFCLDRIKGPAGFKALFASLSGGPLQIFIVNMPWQAGKEFQNADLPALESLECMTQIPDVPEEPDHGSCPPFEGILGAKLPLLESLTLSLDHPPGSTVALDIPAQIKNLEVLPSLKQLSLKTYRLDRDAMERLAGRLPSLDVLELHCDSFLERQIEYLFPVYPQTDLNLKRLGLSGLTDGSAIELVGAAPRMKLLEELDIELKSSGAQLCTKILVASGRLGCWPLLSSLRCANLNADSAGYLCHDLYWPQLEILTLSGQCQDMAIEIGEYHRNLKVMY